VSARLDKLETDLRRLLGTRLHHSVQACGELTISVAAGDLHEICQLLRDDEHCAFEQLIDLCGVDYSQYGEDEWATSKPSSSGFSRGVAGSSTARLKFGDELPAAHNGRARFAVVYHLLSYRHNQRLRLRCYTEDDELPRVASVTDIWPVADWYEREAFDLFGIFFDGHVDLRRLLTDYGFVGHPFRKDFPLIGNVEVRYDPQRQRVIYEPVTIEPRVGVPRVIRDDSRYLQAQNEGQNEIAGKAG
jgi:NADH-quinone oxidoreductase subunit C